jgi:hypothetical protein
MQFEETFKMKSVTQEVQIVPRALQVWQFVKAEQSLTQF